MPTPMAMNGDPNNVRMIAVINPAKIFDDVFVFSIIIELNIL